MKILSVLLMSLFVSITSFAAEEENSFLTCMTGPVATAKGTKSYEAHLLTEEGKGVTKMAIYANQGRHRTELPMIDIFRRGQGRISEWIDVKTRNVVLAYKERAAPTREGYIVITDGDESFELDVTCYL